MSQWQLTDEQRMLEQSLVRFIATKSDFEHRRHRLAGDTPDRLALWKPLAELGAIGALAPESRGGLGGSATDLAVVVGAAGPGLLVEPLLATAMAIRILEAVPEQQALVEAIVAGERVVVLAHGEGFDAFAPPRVIASANGGGFWLDGEKSAVRHAELATDLLVTARMPDGRTGVFLVGLPAAGLARTPTRLIDAAGAADLGFINVAIRAPLLADAQRLIEDALEWGLAGLCAETLAVVTATNAATFEFMNMREQFGQALSQFQALQHRAADMAIAGQQVAAMAAVAIAAAAQPPSAERSRSILAASLACDTAARLVGHTAVQLFGGVGVSDELVVSHYARRLSAIRYQLGGIDARIARLANLEKDLV